MAERLATRLEDLVLIQPKVFGDERGFFAETYRRDEWAVLGVPASPSRRSSSTSRLPSPSEGGTEILDGTLRP